MPMMMGNQPPEKNDIDRLCKAVSESVWTISAITALSEYEVFEILENIHVEKADEINDALLALDGIGSIQRVGRERLGIVIEEVIAVIAHGAGLDADELVEVLTEKRDGSVEDIIYWLHYGRRRRGDAIRGEAADAGNR